jgi:rod shape-determining protein MreD
MRRGVTVRMVGPLQLLVYPSLVVLGLTVLLGTPVQLFGLNLPEPILPMVLAFAWPLIRPSMGAPLMLLALGLFLDIFWYAPLGLWPLSLLAVYGAVLASRNLLAGQETRVLFVWYSVCTLVAFSLAYAVVALRVGQAPSVLALFWQIVPTLLIFPAADWMIQRFDDGDVRFR